VRREFKEQGLDKESSVFKEEAPFQKFLKARKFTNQIEAFINLVSSEFSEAHPENSPSYQNLGYYVRFSHRFLLFFGEKCLTSPEER